MQKSGSMQGQIRTRKTDDPIFQSRILGRYNRGMSICAISKELNFAYPSIYTWLKAQGLDTSSKRHASRRAEVLINSRGYREIYRPEHENANRDGYVKEHVLKACNVLGRAMKPNEVVHHINGDKLDNRNENLLICDRKYHTELHWRMSDLYAKEHFA